MDKQPFVPRYRQIYQDLKKKISAVPISRIKTGIPIQPKANTMYK